MRILTLSVEFRSIGVGIFYSQEISCENQNMPRSIFLSSDNVALTRRGRVTHKCVSKLTIIGQDSDLSPVRHQAIIWTNAGILLIRTPWINFSAVLSKNHKYPFKKVHLKMSFAKWQPCFPRLNLLRIHKYGHTFNNVILCHRLNVQLSLYCC